MSIQTDSLFGADFSAFSAVSLGSATTVLSSIALLKANTTEKVPCFAAASFLGVALTTSAVKAWLDSSTKNTKSYWKNFDNHARVVVPTMAAFVADSFHRFVKIGIGCYTIYCVYTVSLKSAPAVMSSIASLNANTIVKAACFAATSFLGVALTTSAVKAWLDSSTKNTKSYWKNFANHACVVVPAMAGSVAHSFYRFAKIGTGCYVVYCGVKCYLDSCSMASEALNKVAQNAIVKVAQWRHLYGLH